MLFKINYICFICTVGLYLVRPSSSRFITVDAHAEECFFDKVEAGTKMGLTFDVTEGGFLDINLRIVGPDGKNIHEAERETSGKYSFTANTQGVYTYCFSNKVSTMTPKVVMFNMAVGEPPSQDTKTTNKLEDMIREFGDSTN